MGDSSIADTVIYTDTWSGRAKYDFTDTAAADTMPQP